MKLFMVVLFAFWLAGCEPRSIHSTYQTMKADIPWLQSFCRNNPQPPVISYKGSSVYIYIYCDIDLPPAKWVPNMASVLKAKGWVAMQEDDRTFCHPITGVELSLPWISDTRMFTRVISMSFPNGRCSKFRPNPYQPLATENEANQFHTWKLL